MKIIFETETTGDYSTQLELSTIEKGVFVSVSHCVLGVQETSQIHFLDKQELKKFIGALLHVQSNLNK